MLRPSELLRVPVGTAPCGFPLKCVPAEFRCCRMCTFHSIRRQDRLGGQDWFSCTCGRAVPSDPRVLWVAHAAAADAALLRELLARL